MVRIKREQLEIKYPKWYLPKEESVKEILDFYNIPYSKNVESGYLWTGKCVNLKRLFSRPKYEFISNAYHEVAHHMLSSKTAKKHFDYGLGSSPDSEHIKKYYSNYFVGKQENMASILGMYLMLERKVPKHYVSYSVFLHGWRSYQNDSVIVYLKDALKKANKPINKEHINKIKKIIEKIENEYQ